MGEFLPFPAKIGARYACCSVSFLNILGVVIAAVGVTGLLSLIRRASEIGRLGRDELEDLDDLPVIDGWSAVASDFPVALTAKATPGEGGAHTMRISSSRDRLLLCLALACVALGAVQNSLLILCVGGLGLVLLGRARLRDARFARHAVVAAAYTERVIGPTYCESGVAYVEVEGCSGPIAVTVPWRLCRSLVDRHGAVALLVAFEPKRPNGRAFAIGVRAPAAALATALAAADAVLVPARRPRRDGE